VLAAWDAAQDEPAPFASTPVDEFDLPEATVTEVHAAQDEDPAAPEADGAVTQEFFLHETEEAYEEVDRHGSGFADALQRYGVDASTLPAGYLPAADLFSHAAEEDIDVRARRKRRRKRGWITAIVVVVVLAVVGGAGWFGLNRLFAPAADYDGNGSGSISFTIREGEGNHQIGKELAAADIVKSADAFYDEMNDQDTTPTFKPGKFAMRKKMSAASALSILQAKSGKVSYFSVPSNARMTDVLDTIAKETKVDRAELDTMANSPKEFGLPSGVKNLEGYLHPGEYRFPLDSSAKQILAKLVKKTQASLKSQGVSDPSEQYRYLKLGSVVAGEGGVNDYKHIAGILDNRMQPNDETHGLLQLDSTVSYGLGQVSIHLTKDQLKDKKNPYNTYVHKGLPPTPIGSPGDKAIEAAVHPTKSHDYYWVTVNLKTGETKFASTLSEHEKNVAQYRKWCDANSDYCK
jgi:UPF0755 protein